MKRTRLYDFNLFNAIVVLAAYAVVFAVSLFMLLHDDGDRTAGIVFNAALAGSLVALVAYYVVLAPTAAADGVRHLRRFIPYRRLTWDVVDNTRFKITEIVLTDASIRDPAASRRSAIRIQHTTRTETFLKGYAPDGGPEGGKKT